MAVFPKARQCQRDKIFARLFNLISNTYFFLLQFMFTFHWASVLRRAHPSIPSIDVWPSHPSCWYCSAHPIDILSSLLAAASLHLVITRCALHPSLLHPSLLHLFRPISLPSPPRLSFPPSFHQETSTSSSFAVDPKATRLSTIRRGRAEGRGY